MHVVHYDNAPSGWNEALPLGNGHFGGMMFFEDNKLTMAMNHYEVYYRKLHRYSNKARNGEERTFRRAGGKTFDELKRLAAEKVRDPAGEPYFSYRETLGYSYNDTRYGKPAGGASHYPTGEIGLLPCGRLAEPDNYSLRLDVESAAVELRIEKEGDRLEARTIVAWDGDFVVTEVEQTEGSLLEAFTMELPLRKYAELTASYGTSDDSTFYYKGSFYPDGEDREKYEPFAFLVMTKLIGASGDAEAGADAMRIRLRDAGRSVTLITTVVFAEEQTGELPYAARTRLERAAARLPDILARHRGRWDGFWQRSAVALPDPLLEDLWYVNLYALACCNGKGGRMFEQACGLNGLWDIKQPTKWGSMWYWDVNIQAAFWPLYTANHLEIAEAFHDALLTYVGSAERMAREFYGLDGVAGDYPHAFYFCIWPWCAQFLWHYYEYSMDEAFLKEKAYPLFRRILRFFEGYLQFEPDKERYVVFPDISPEQGPLTRNSTGTLSSLNYLLRIAVEASVLLGVDADDRERWKDMAAKLAPYPTGISGTYGETIRDSEWAPEHLHLRHPTLLMPIYPIGEIDRHSEERLRMLAENTLRYAEEHTEFGLFQFGWLSCAASRLGRGNTALRLLYEQGIDLSLRCNGLFAEETERWINYCNITNEPLYYPPMTEASGELVAAINEMLLQSYDGVIDVFPAVPNGEPEPERVVGMKQEDASRKARPYSRWDDCAFRGLRAVGAFEVDAERRGGRTLRVVIRSLAGRPVALRNPFAPKTEVSVTRVDGTAGAEVDFHAEDGRIAFATEIGGEYEIAARGDASPTSAAFASAGAVSAEPRVREAHTGRRVFLGQNRDTPYIKLLDHFTFDYYSGNYRESRTAVYRLDFGRHEAGSGKRYADALPKQFHMEGVMGQDFRPISPESAFTTFSGIGWERTDGLIAVDRGAPDELRRDFVGGAEEMMLLLELPRGRYDLLFVSGDSEAPSYTEIDIEGQSVWKPERPLKAGEFAADLLPVPQKKDGYAKIRFRTLEGFLWKINALIVNKNYPYV